MNTASRASWLLLAFAASWTFIGGSAVAEEPSANSAELKALSTAEVVERCDPSIAVVRGPTSFGTGFLVRPGILATNAHVIDDVFLHKLEIRFPSAPEGQKGPFSAELLFEDGNRDLAFLKVKSELAPLAVAEKFRFRKGEDVTIIGSPGFGDDGQLLENAVSRGVLSTEVVLDERKLYQLGASVNPGNSGGPVIDVYGKVIGVATLKAVKQEAVSFCIPSLELFAALETLDIQTEAAVAQLRADHDLNAAVRLLSVAGPLHVIAMQAALIKSVENSKIKGFVSNIQSSFEGLGDEATTVAGNEQIAKGQREELEKLTKDYRELLELTGKVLDSPPSELAMLRSKVTDLKKEYFSDLEPLLESQKLHLSEFLASVLKSDLPVANSQQIILYQAAPRPSGFYQPASPGRFQAGAGPQPGGYRPPQPGGYRPPLPGGPARPGVYRPGVPQPGMVRPGVPNRPVPGRPYR